ncbi:MAG: VOC family protein [Actinobacteria bacterium]|nr:VOC family protein [Actinomycetota bacterium]
MDGVRGSPPVARLGAVIIDCRDPERLAAFWGTLLGARVMGRLGDPPQYVDLEPLSEGPYLGFQRVPEPKVVKNRVHLDLNVDDVERATQRIQALGGTRASLKDVREYGYAWRVMLDPEGNEFCLIFE